MRESARLGCKSFAKIPTRYSDPNAPIMWIVDGDSEEAVTRSTPGEIHSWVSQPLQNLLLLADVCIRSGVLTSLSYPESATLRKSLHQGIYATSINFSQFHARPRDLQRHGRAFPRDASVPRRTIEYHSTRTSST